MSDAHDEAAKALFDWAGDRDVVEVNVDASRAQVADMLRKAAADEREACAVICSAMSVSETSYGQPVATRQLLWAAELIRARAKGGALSVQASGVHDCAEGHSKSCTCSYCEVGR